MTSLTLTPDQQNAYGTFGRFLIDDQQSVLLLEGYAGTGKSTLVSYILEQYPKIISMIQLCNGGEIPKTHPVELCLSATTNKAAEALQSIVGPAYDVGTIQSRLGLMVHKNYVENKTSLIVNPRAENDILTNKVIFIDEGSFLNYPVTNWFDRRTQNCKFFIIGDPAQLLDVGSKAPYIFNMGFPTARLEEVVRQAKGNPIIDLATAFRHTVNTGKFFSFKPDGEHVAHMSRKDFDLAIEKEYKRHEWNSSHSRILAWTNARVQEYNARVNHLRHGRTGFEPGDYAICNSYVKNGKTTVKTDEVVRIAVMAPETAHGVAGYRVSLRDKERGFFLPPSFEARKAKLKEARKAKDYPIVYDIEERWIDLRPAYACTINKSQGSTYDKVFIDLDDLKRCRHGNQLARMLYVAVSRARNQVIFTGDLV